MADPVVTITNGVPTAGSGIITTLGQTLLDGANITIGATTDAAVAAGAAGSANAHLRSISRDIVGGIVLQAGANVIGGVTQSGGPWSVSGTLNAAQSGAWNITNITGTVSLPTGASTSALQPTNAGQASTTSGQTGHLMMGAVTTSPPSYTTLQTDPLSLTPAGGLRVDGSSVTQPVSGTFWQATQPVSIAAAVTVAQATAANLNATVAGTVTANQGGAWTMNPATIGNWGLSPSTQNTAAPTNDVLVSGQFNTSPTTITSGNCSPLQLDSSANLRVNVMAGTVGVSGTVNVSASQFGTWTNQRIQTAANTNLTASRVVAAASTNATSLKAAAGCISAIDVFNVAAYMVFLKLYNKASAPIVGTDTPVWTIPIPAGGGFSIDDSTGEYFSTGIAYAITKLQADSDTTATAAGDVTGRIKWV